MQAQVAVELVRVAAQAQEPAEVEIVRVAFAPASQAPVAAELAQAAAQAQELAEAEIDRVAIAPASLAPVRCPTFASVPEPIRFRVDPSACASPITSAKSS